VVAVLGVIGFVVLARRDWRIALAIFIGFFLPIYAAVSVPNAERGRYFMMSNWLLFFLTALGTQAALIAPVQKIDRGSMRQSLLTLILMACLLSP
jgi:hypothetical protein